MIGFGLAAPVLFSEGWGNPVPCAPGAKKPLLPEWSYYCGHLAKAIQVDLWSRKWPQANTAIAVSCQNDLIFLDQDLDDQRDADRATGIANDMLGYTPLVRIGREPRWLRIYRSREAVNLTRRGLELKATSGLCTVYGLHAGTGREYYWPDTHLLEASVTDAPEVTAEALAAYRHALESLLPAPAACLPLTAIRPETGVEGPAAPFLRLIADNPDRDFLDVLVDALTCAQIGEWHLTMFGVVVAAVMSGASDDEVLSRLLPVFADLHSAGESRACRGEVVSALKWIRNRHGPDRFQAAAMQASLPWIGANSEVL